MQRTGKPSSAKFDIYVNEPWCGLARTTSGLTRMFPVRAKLLSLATAVPEHELRTDEVMVEATKIFGGRQEDFDRMMPVYANTGINMRYSACSYDWFREEQGWPERSEAFVTGASQLFGVVSGRALELARLEADQIDTIVMISSTGIATPTIEARVIDRKSVV